MKQRWKSILFTLLALTSIPLAVMYTEQAISNQPQPEQYEEAVVAPRVTVLPLTTGQYQSVIQAYGEVKPVDQINLSSEISGRVIWRNPKFTDGGRVKKGEALIRLDDTDFQAALASAKQALAEAELAVQQEERQRRLAQRDWQRSGLADKPSALLLREPQLKVAKAQYQAAKTVLTQAQRNLALTRLKAPFSAVVLDRSVARGSYVEQGMRLATLQASDEAEISLALSANQWQLLPAKLVGLKVQLYSRDGQAMSWRGRVQRLTATVDQRTRLRSLVVTVKRPLDKKQPLLFGSFVSAEIKGLKISNLFALPASALTADGYIWRVKAGQLQRQRRTPLFSQAGHLFVRQEDLPPQIQLVRKPMASYLPGMQVSAYIEGENQ
jgi:membrane fusion protein, multidrug efflux system